MPNSQPQVSGETKTFRVLIADPIEASGLTALEGVAAVDIKTGLPAEELQAIIGEYDALMVRSQTKVTAAIIEAGAKLKIIGRAGVGVDNIDVPAATRRGILVVNSPAGNTIAAAEHSLAMMMALSRHIPAADASTKAGEWKRSKFMGSELYDKTLGVIGLGKIGSHVASVAQALGMKVVAYDPFVTPERASELGVSLASVSELVSLADYVTVHVPKTPETTHLLDAPMLAKAKPGVRIVNCARGGIIDEEALVEAIKSGQVAGAALDVFEQEPLDKQALRDLGDRVILTPHLGASTEEAQLNVAIDVAEQIAEVLAGGEARAAVNMPSVRPELLAVLKPFFPLAERLGAVAAQLADGPVESVEVAYMGALAEEEVKPLTAAVLKGVLTPAMRERVNFVNATHLAKERGVSVTEVKSAEETEYVDLIRIKLRTPNRERIVAGTLLSNDLLSIVQIDDYAFNLFPTGTLLFAPHQDVPGSVGRLGMLLGERQINIFGMQLGRKAKHGPALMVLNLDEHVPEAVLDEVMQLPGFFDVKVVHV